MELILSSAGSYPRIGVTPDTQRHRRADAPPERGAINATDWRAVVDEIAEQVVREQTATGLDIVTDGQVRWYDPISHLARHCEGIQINGLLRYFDTNFYFRQPVVSGRIRRREPVLRREFEVARAATARSAWRAAPSWRAVIATGESWREPTRRSSPTRSPTSFTPAPP